MSLYEQLRDKNKLNKDKGLNELSIIRVISNTHGGYRVKTIYKTAIANNKVYTIPGDKLAQIIMNGLFYVQNFSMCINCKDAAFMKFVPSYKIEGYNAKTLHIDIDKFNITWNELEGEHKYNFEDFCDYISNFIHDKEDNYWECSSTNDKCRTIIDIVEWLTRTNDVNNIDNYIAKCLSHM